MSEAIELRRVFIVKSHGWAYIPGVYEVYEGGYNMIQRAFRGSLAHCHRIKDAYMSTGLYKDETADDINDMGRDVVIY